MSKAKAILFLLLGWVLNTVNVLNAQEATPFLEEEIFPSSTLCPATPYRLLYPYHPEVEGYFIEFGAWRYMFPEFATFIGNNVFGHTPNTPLRAIYMVHYIGGMTGQEGQDLPTRFFMLINEEFVPLGTEGELYRDIILPYRQRELIELVIPPLEEGVYNVAIIGIGNYEALPDIHGDIPSMIPFHYRMSIVVGNASTSVLNRDYTRLDGPLADASENIRSNTSYADALTVFSPDTTQPWTQSADVTMGEDYVVNLQLGPTAYFSDYTLSSYEYPNTRRFALLALQDYQPITLGNNTNAFYGEMSLDAQYVEYPLTLTASTLGRHDLIFIRIDEPDQLACHLIEPQPVGVSTRRVAVEVHEAG